MTQYKRQYPISKDMTEGDLQLEADESLERLRQIRREADRRMQWYEEAADLATDSPEASYIIENRLRRLYDLLDKLDTIGV